MTVQEIYVQLELIKVDCTMLNLQTSCARTFSNIHRYVRQHSSSGCATSICVHAIGKNIIAYKCIYLR